MAAPTRRGSLAARASPAARDQGRAGVAGVLQVRRDAFIQFLDEDGALFAELKKPGGSGFDRLPLATATDQRRLVDEARLRARPPRDE